MPSLYSWPLSLGSSGTPHSLLLSQASSTQMPMLAPISELLLSLQRVAWHLDYINYQSIYSCGEERQMEDWSILVEWWRKWSTIHITDLEGYNVIQYNGQIRCSRLDDLVSEEHAGRMYHKTKNSKIVTMPCCVILAMHYAWVTSDMHVIVVAVTMLLLACMICSAAIMILG